MAGRLCHGSCMTRILGPSWGAPHSHGFSLPSSTMPALLGSGLSCSSSSFNSSRTINLSGPMTQALMLIIFFQFIQNDQPKWTHDSGSLIGKSPALGVRPGQNWEHIDSSMLIFNKDKKMDGKTIPGYAQWVDRTNMFLEENGYQTTTVGPDGIKNVNRTDELKALKACSGEEDDNFGYSTGQPCILLKLNKIYGLEPTYITDHEDMPEELKTRIASANNKKQVWVSCIGENAADQEGMGEIEYFPKDGGFDSAYYPYVNQDNYRSPLIAVRFKKPETSQFLHVECRAWAG